MPRSGLEDSVFPKPGQTTSALSSAMRPLAPAGGSGQMSSCPATLHSKPSAKGSLHWNTNTSTSHGYRSLFLLHYHLFAGDKLWQRNGVDDWDSNSSDAANTRKTPDRVCQTWSGLRTNPHHSLSLFLFGLLTLVQSQRKSPKSCDYSQLLASDSQQSPCRIGDLLRPFSGSQVYLPYTRNIM